MLVRFLFVLPFMILGGWWVWDGIMDTTQQLRQLLRIRNSNKNLFG